MTIENKNSLAGLFPALGDVPRNIRIDEPLIQQHILIDGKLRTWDGPVHQVYSPIRIHQPDGSLKPAFIGSYPLATPIEAGEALQAATRAYDKGRGKWPSMSLKDRIGHLELFTEQMIARKEPIVKLIVWEIGKTITDANKEFDRTVDYIRETIGAAKKQNNLTVQLSVIDNFIGQTRRMPLGVVLCMGPFNYPLNETFTTLIPALIMGNTVLFKPPKQGTLLFEPLLEAFASSFPEGVVNTVYGRGRDIVPELMRSGGVDVLALIGSSRVADSLKKLHPKSNRLRAILGLDAKNAAIVLPDANLQVTVKEIIAGALSFNGQRCTALKIIFVDAAIANEFNELLVKELRSVKIGMPWEEGIMITPMAEPDKPEYLKDCIEDALSHGASILNADDGGGAINQSLVKPTVLYPVNEKMTLYHEEQFGPLIPVVPFETLDIPVDYITDSPFGQQASIFGQDTDTISRLIDSLAGQVGRININSQSQRGPDRFPFNGRKDSAEGTLSIEDALYAFSVDSVVASKHTKDNERLVQSILVNNQSTRFSNVFSF